MKLKIGDPYNIKWQDAQTEEGWSDLSEFKAIHKDGTDAFCISLGFLMAEGKNTIVLGQSTTPLKDDFCNYIEIPKGMIISIRKLKI